LGLDEFSRWNTLMDDLTPPALAPSRAQTVQRRGRLMPWLIMVVVLGIVVVLVLRLKGASTGSHYVPLAPQAVGIATVTPHDMQVVDNGLGTVTSLATITVQTQISGVLQTIGFKEGQIVHKGDFLAQIDPRPYQALLDQARGTLLHDQGLLKEAQMDEKRYETLHRQDSIGRQQYEDQVFVVQQYQGSVAADQGSIEAQQVNLDFCHITSPVTGRVGLRQVDQGNYVTPSLANGIVVVTQLDPISVIFTLPEDDVAPIQEQLAAGATLQVVAYDRSNTVQVGTGTLETIDNQIDTTTGTVKLRALFANPKFTLFPNQFVNLRLIVSTVKNALTVPNAAIQTGAPGSFVYVVQPDSTVAVQVVKPGVADSERTQILEGLEAGQKIVVDGADRLRDGAHVTVPGPTTGFKGARGTHHWDPNNPEAHHHHRESAD